MIRGDDMIGGGLNTVAMRLFQPAAQHVRRFIFGVRALRYSPTLLLMAFVVPAGWGSGVQAAPVAAMDRPFRVVKADIGTAIGCERWLGFDVKTVCLLRDKGDVISLSSSLTGDVESIEMIVLIAGNQGPPAPDSIPLQTVNTVVGIVLPAWKSASGWLRDAVHRVEKSNHRRVTKVGPLTVMAERLKPTESGGPSVLIVITKKKSLTEWDFDVEK